MKNSILTVLFSVFLISCQTNGQIENSNIGTLPKIQNSNFTKIEVNADEFFKASPMVSPTVEPKETGNLISKIGNIESGETDICLKIPNPNLKVGDKVQVVMTEIPQKVFQAEISEKTACRNESFGNLENYASTEFLTEYLLKPSENNISSSGFGIGIVTAQTAKVEKGFVVMDTDNDKKNEFFRQCTSNEGMHLTVWKGKPLTGKRVWHSYYDFSYDTVPDCKEKDYKD